MIKSYLLMLLQCIVCITCSVAQNEQNFWYFGEHAGMDFNSGAPVALMNSAMTTTEGCSVISDIDGNLLFYTNGETVWNKNHAQMPNGFGLLGGFSSSQSAIIIPLPGSTTTFYIFTVGQTGGTFRYSIVDLTLQGGLGDVTTKNVLIHNTVAEKITAVQNANGTDVWVIAHSLNTAAFYVAPFTSAGVGTLITSTTTGPNPGGINKWTGCMKTSQDGSKLAMTNYALFSCDVFDFDNTTGAFTFSFTYSPGPGFYAYGVEFSRDGSRLYIGNVDYMPGQIYQLDMTAGTAADIIASATLVANSNLLFFGALQLAPDDKIYVSRWADTFLGVINDPAAIGTACNYVDQGFNLAPKYGWLGLPGFVAKGTSVALPAFSAVDSSICEKFCTGFFDSSTNNPTSWQWYFEGGDPASSTDQNPGNVCYSAPGTFDVTLITTNASGSDTLTLPDFITVYPTPAIPAITQSGYTLTSTSAANYQWQFNSVDIPGATNQSYAVTQSGYYSVFITDENGCTSSSSNIYVLITGVDDLFADANVSIYPNPSNESITLTLTNLLLTDPLEVKIYNTIGQLVFSMQEKISGNQFSKKIDTRSLTAGVYFLTLQSSDDQVTEKIMINH